MLLNAQDTVREAVFNVLGDLYVVFGGPNLDGGPLTPLHAPPTAKPLRRLWGVCEAILDQQVQVGLGSQCSCRFQHLRCRRHVVHAHVSHG
jgi:hypothetical protein